VLTLLHLLKIHFYYLQPSRHSSCQKAKKEIRFSGQHAETEDRLGIYCKSRGPLTDLTLDISPSSVYHIVQLFFFHSSLTNAVRQTLFHTVSTDSMSLQMVSLQVMRGLIHSCGKASFYYKVMASLSVWARGSYGQEG